MKILAIDLGSSKSVYGLSEALGGPAQYGSVATTPEAFHDLLVDLAPERVVVEVGSPAGWVKDLCDALEMVEPDQGVGDDEGVSGKVAPGRGQRNFRFERGDMVVAQIADHG